MSERLHGLLTPFAHRFGPPPRVMQSGQFLRGHIDRRAQANLRNLIRSDIPAQFRVKAKSAEVERAEADWRNLDGRGGDSDEWHLDPERHLT